MILNISDNKAFKMAQQDGNKNYMEIKDSADFKFHMLIGGFLSC